MSNRSIHTLLKNWDEECPLTREEAVEVLNLPEEEMDSLMECAYALRTKYKGKKVSVQLLTNVRSGNCTQNCAYCAQSKDSQAEIEKYKRVSDEKLYGDPLPEIVKDRLRLELKFIQDNGYSTIFIRRIN